MSRLINDDELKKSIHEKTLFSKWQKVLIETVIDDQPTVDAVPVVHGRWIDEGQYGDNFPHHAWRCSECGEHVIEIDTSWYKYCPNCGVDMRGEQDG